jgi:hypothetical protein
MSKRDARAKREAAAWTYPVGTVVDVTRDNGSVQRTKTRSAAEVMGCEAVIWLEGIAGCYALSRVRAVTLPDGFPAEIPRDRAVELLRLIARVLPPAGGGPWNPAGSEEWSVEARALLSRLGVSERPPSPIEQEFGRQRNLMATSTVEPRCHCHLEIGDSPCPVHGDDECPVCGETFVAAGGHQCRKDEASDA